MIALLVTAALRIQSVADVEALTSRHEYAAALAAAAQLALPDERARAEVDIRYRAGDLFGARRTALRAIDAGCTDAVLALRAAELCTTLRDAGGARTAIAALERAVSSAQLGGEQEAGWQALLARRQVELRELEHRNHDGRNSLSRARWIAGAFLVLLGAAALILSRRSAPELLRRDPGFPTR